MGMKRKSRKAYFYLAPALVSILIFTVMPIAATIYYAFTDYTYIQREMSI